VARFTVSRSVDPATAARLLLPRDDIVGERPATAAGEGEPAGAGGTVPRRVGLGDGPFTSYGRQGVVGAAGPDPAARAAAGGGSGGRCARATGWRCRRGGGGSCSCGSCGWPCGGTGIGERPGRRSRSPGGTRRTGPTRGPPGCSG